MASDLTWRAVQGQPRSVVPKGSSTACLGISTSLEGTDCYRSLQEGVHQEGVHKEYNTEFRSLLEKIPTTIH